MTNEDFKNEMKKSFSRSEAVLSIKEREYSSGKDRLDQFYRAAMVQRINPTEALVGMMTKHFTSICDMAKDPTSHHIQQWREKTGDLRNYTILLEALLIDMEVPDVNS